MIADYVEIQKAYADLLDAMYRLTTAQVGQKAWDRACLTLSALIKIEPNYRDTKRLAGQLQPLGLAEELRRAGELRNSSQILLTYLQQHDDPVIRRRFEETLVCGLNASAADGRWNDVTTLLNIVYPNLGGEDFYTWLQRQRIPHYIIGPGQITWQCPPGNENYLISEWNKLRYRVIERTETVNFLEYGALFLSVTFLKPGVFWKADMYIRNASGSENA